MVVEARGATAVFLVTYVGFPREAPEVQEAFQRAVDLWADLVVSDEPIRVNANWVAFDNENTLGAAGPFIAKFNPGESRPDGFEADVWYPLALVNARLGRDLAPGSPDIEAEFNSAFERWHFGLGPPGDNQFDFTTVVLHELAHGLGFIGALTAEDGVGTLVPTQGNREPFAFDLLAQDCEGNSALDESRYPRPSNTLGSLLTGRALYLGGPTLDTTTGLNPAPLYAPADWNPGSSYSHLNESTFEPSTQQSLMTPFFSSGERILSPGALTCAVLADMGWALGGECNRLLNVQSPVVIDIGGDACAGVTPPNPNPTQPTPTTDSFRLDDFWPTVVSLSAPFVPRTGRSAPAGVFYFDLYFGTVTDIRVDVYNLQGRLVTARLFTAPEDTEQEVEFDLRSLNLSAGP
ncbi:MAG: hypothetical protein AAFN13_03395, partial [Bacteroidota bacterium]